ncbi:hypothetical protein ACFFV8_12070 [Sphingobium indicum]|uniref:hypothetical protein n=1 Tax=Sphingobium TaxID=165695 RepID=UPI000F66A938|nr:MULTISPECIES: hypothetical protein [Sphingobium]
MAGSIVEQATRAAVAELYRQAEKGKPGPYVDDEADKGIQGVIVDGIVDMVAVTRAVLTAIREPSAAVRQALRDNVPVDGHEWDYVEREELSNGRVLDPEADCWRAMIDAILQEGG